jgi:hypothetical protein
MRARSPKRGMRHTKEGFDNRLMARRTSANHKLAFKQTQIFDWDSEPAEERPSEFGHSTGYGTVSGAFIRAPRRRARGPSYLLIGSMIVCLGIVALMFMKEMLHG